MVKIIDGKEISNSLIEKFKDDAFVMYGHDIIIYIQILFY